ncbi:MAG TPA: SDR family NAD(P)-dependent oxidoreductase [Gemmatimonadaceae bacterium]|nr:SDR family NAD(P)-dependent oxidoreductase [Gemmatimonadaceae bacterium]
MPELIRYLEDQHAVVTGGSRGIGAAIAAEFVRRGARVTIMGRSAETLEERAREMRGEKGATVSTEECDVSNADSVANAFSRSVSTLGPVQILVNNAGTAKSRLFTQTSLALWNELIGVNLTGTFLCTSEVVPAMMEAKRGRIVNVASTAGLRGYKTMSAYCASKHGVIGLTRVLSQETAKHGITVNAVCPGYTDTDLTDSAVKNIVENLGKTAEEAMRMLTSVITRGTLITVDEVASAVSWLCSPDASGVTGVALPIAGGEIQ